MLAESDTNVDLVAYERTARSAKVRVDGQEKLTSCMPTHRSSGCSGLELSATSWRLKAERTGDGSNDDTSDGPTHLDGRSCESSEGERYDLTSVCGRVGNEESPRNTFKELTNSEDR